MSKIAIITEKGEAAFKVASALYNLGERSEDLFSSFAEIEQKCKKKLFVDAGNYVVFWTDGHLGKDLKPHEIKEEYSLKRFSPEYDYKMPNLYHEIKRVIKPEKKDFFLKVSKIYKSYNFKKIYICTDADQEGERIARDFLFEFLKENPNQLDIRRMWIQGAFDTPKAIKKELEEALPYNAPKYENLYYSQKARGNGDYLQGVIPINILVALYYPKKLYSGRVRNCIIGLTGDRELEIKNWKQKFYYVINGIFDFKMNHFYMQEIDDVDKNGNLIQKLERTTKYFNEIEANLVLKTLKDNNLTGIVTKYDKDTQSSKTRPLPLSGDDFKAEMSNLYKTSLDDSLNMLQYLRDEGFTTYQGTNGRYFSKVDEGIVKTAYETALKVFSGDENIKSANFSLEAGLFDDKAAAKQNHPPLHLTDKVPTQKDYEKWEKHKLKNIKEGYELIAKRILVHFLENDLFEKVTFEVSIKDYKFDATGIKPLKNGWRSFLNEKRSNNYFEVAYKVGDSFTFKDLEVIKKEVNKPKPYKELDILATLMNVSKVLNSNIEAEEDPVRKLELKKAKNILYKVEGIGTDRTRVLILKELMTLNLIQLTKDKNLALTEDGWCLYNLLPKELIKVTYTAKWEEDFEDIRRGEKSYDEFINSLKSTMNKTIDYLIANKNTSLTIKETTKTNLSCPICNSIILDGNNSFRCEKYVFKDGVHSGCKFIIIKNQKLLEAKFGLKQVERILNGETLTAPNNKKVYLDLDNNFFLKILDPSDEVFETEKTFRLGDKFIYKSVFGKNLTKNQATKILNGEEVKLKRVNKQEKEYTVTVWFLENGKVESSF